VSDIFREIDEELRRDNFLKLWSRYGRYVIAAAALALAIAGGVVAWRAHELAWRQAQSARYAGAMALAGAGKTADAAIVFASIVREGGGYSVLASFEDAAMRVKSGDRKGAVAIYDGIAKAGGVDPDSLIVTPMAPSETLAAFSRGAIDGFVNGPPWPQVVLQDGTGVAVASPLTGDPDWIAPNGSGVIVTRPQFCIDYRSVCVKLGHGLAEGAKFIHDKPDEALALLKKHFDKIDPAVVERAFKAVVIGTPVPPSMTATVLGNSERLNIDAGLMAASDQLKSYDGLFTDEFVR